jgi:acetyl esterase/lipase
VSSFHPDLRRHAWYMPRDLGVATTLRLLRRLDAVSRRRPPSDLTVVPLGPAISVRLFRGAITSCAAPALLWIHGGGYVFGRAHQDDQLYRDSLYRRL